MRNNIETCGIAEVYKELRLAYPRLSNEEFDTLFNSSASLPYGAALVSEKQITRACREKMMGNFARRSSGTAVEYITGSADFMGFTFEMKDGVFIPKNSTEALVDKLLKISSPGMRLLDVGCGSGNICITAAKLGNFFVTACDINPAAVALTRKNAEKMSVDIRVLKSDLFSEIKGTFDIIACNPPYINEGEALDEAVMSQPREALFSGGDGLDCIKKIARQAHLYLNESGRLFLEMGAGQRGDVEKELLENGWKNVSFAKDLSGITRIAEASC
ncbi:MAG: peptide chain release factor N(5)-glutamine methyltransferase [Elusimicrobiota bacterium]|nr:peptide chain release factor N(5)-glutamine methyltransferase [Elusimicrobiota bacterium]